MKPSIGWLVHLGLAGSCLIWAGCGGGGDVPDPDSDSKAASEPAPSAPPPVVANNEEAPPAAAAPNKEGAAAEEAAAAATEPPASQEGAAAKSESSSTNEMLALSATPAPASGEGEKPAEGAGGEATAPSPGGGTGPGGMMGMRPPGAGGPGAGYPGMNGPGGGTGPGAMGGMPPGMAGPGGGTGPGAMGGRGGAGMAMEGPGGGGMAGMGGMGGDNSPPDFRSPIGGVTAFLKALRMKDAAALAEATALHAPMEASERNRKIFEAITREELAEDDLAELAAKLDGFNMSGKNHPKSTNVEEIILTKRSTTSNDTLVRTIQVRKEKQGWKVLDIGGQGTLQGPLMRLPRPPSLSVPGRSHPRPRCKFDTNPL